MKKSYLIKIAKSKGLNISQINRVVKSFNTSKNVNKKINSLKKINIFVASNKGVKRLKWLRSNFGIKVLAKQARKLSNKIKQLKENKIVDKSLQRHFNKVFSQLLLAKQFKAPTKQLKQERAHQRKHWVGLAKANLNLEKSIMTSYEINRTGQSVASLENYLRQNLHDYKSDLQTLINKGLNKGVLLLLKQEYDTGICYGYISKDELELFSPV